MNDLTKQCIIFASGIGIGSLVTWICTKSYYENKADSEIDDCKQMYERKAEELKEKYYIEIGNSIENSDIKPNDDLNGVEGSTTSLELESPKNSQIIDYTAKYTKKGEGKDLDMIKRNAEALIGEDVVRAEDCTHVDPSELEGPGDDEEMSDDEDDLEQEDYEMYLINEEHKKAVEEGRAPYEIEPESFGTIPGYDTMELFYFVKDNVLCDENHEEVDRPELFVGDLLETNWPNDDSLEKIFIRTDTEMIDVEVTKNLTDRFYSE